MEASRTTILPGQDHFRCLSCPSFLHSRENTGLGYSGFSATSLYGQLIFEEFTPGQAQYAIDNVNADWFAEAVESAESYTEYSAFSASGLYDQLIFEGFTPEQAQHGVNSVQ
ncbi:Ltp family lipoprotein [Corynebacterium occultum]|uniref:Ltp family lipoprotein n=1 Tax=Corynebacterium occultum TaxID=2675219 RepID=UPI0018CCECAF|nr:Ltp family lipoprotein [Corynebacterium occultum]